MKINFISIVLLAIYALTNYKLRTQLAAAEHESRLTYENFLWNSSNCLDTEMDMCIFEPDDMCPFWKNLENTCRVIQSTTKINSKNNQYAFQKSGKNLQNPCKAFGITEPGKESTEIATISLGDLQPSRALMVVIDVLQEQLQQLKKSQSAVAIYKSEDAFDENAATQCAISDTENFDSSDDFISCAESLECYEFASDNHTTLGSTCNCLEHHYVPCHLEGSVMDAHHKNDNCSVCKAAEEYKRLFRIHEDICPRKCLESLAAAGHIHSNCWFGPMHCSDCWSKVGKRIEAKGVVLQACCCNFDCSDDDKHNFYIESGEECTNYDNRTIFNENDGFCYEETQMNEDKIIPTLNDTEAQSNYTPTIHRSESVIVAENDTNGMNVTEIFSEELDLYAIVIIAEGMPIPTDLSYVLTAPLAVNNLTSNPMLADVAEWASQQQGEHNDTVQFEASANIALENDEEITAGMLDDVRMSASMDHETMPITVASKRSTVAEKRMQLVRDLFKRVDVNRDDYVCYHELRQWMHYIEYLHENRLTDQLWQRLITPSMSSLSWPQYSRQIYGYIRPLPHMDGELWNFNDQNIWRDYRRWQFADENNDLHLNRGEFDKFMHVKIGMSLQELFMNETMQLIDINGDHIITFDEYINEIFAERMRDYDMEVNEHQGYSPVWITIEYENFLLDFDLDRNGVMNRSELFHFLNYSISEYIHKRTRAIIAEADANNDQRLTFNEMFNHYALFIGTAIDIE